MKAKALLIAVLALPLSGCSLMAKVQEIPESAWRDICGLIMSIGGAVGKILSLLGLL